MPGFQRCWRCRKHSTMVACGRCEVVKYCSRSCQEGDKWRHKSECDPAVVAKVCQSCRKSSTTLKTCSTCLQVFYCNVDCQKNDWLTHKRNCKTVENNVKRLAKKMTEFYLFNRKTTRLYYWGNYLAFDYLNLEENEGCDHESPLRVLVLGVGDLRNVALTCASLPQNRETEVRFTLNDNEPCTLARLVLLIYMLIQGKPIYVTEVWYSTKLNNETYNSLRSTLRELSAISSSEQLKSISNGLLEVDDIHLHEMRFVWKTWLELSMLESEWITEQRNQAFETDQDSQFGIYSYYLCLPSEHVKSAKDWMNDGIFTETKASLVSENPTLTGCPNIVTGSKYSFVCDSSIFPFTGWDYLKVKEFKHCSSIVKMYMAYINDVLRRCKENLASSSISFHIVLEDCLKIEKYVNPEETYDRILTSNLADYIPLPKLLRLCSKKLNHSNPFATIVTETQNWLPTFCPDADVEALNPFALMEMSSYVIKDTRSNALLRDYGYMTYRDYHDNSKQFVAYLRALFYAFPSDSSESQATCARLPSVKLLGSEYQLELRDFLRNENRIAYFKLPLNCRRASMHSGHARVLEWIPKK